MDIRAASLALHYRLQGKLEMVSRCPIQTQEDLSLAYTPGVAAPCLEIQKDPALSFQLTRRRNLVAVITDGSAVLGLGDIGPLAGMPVMEGKCVLFKEFAGVDAVPLCVDTQDVEEMVQTIALISKSFGGINLEDIAAPRCFEVERRLKERCDIPVFHDDQHGTAVVITAALTNALKVVGKKKEQVKVVLNGIGAAGAPPPSCCWTWGIPTSSYVTRMGFSAPGTPTCSPTTQNWPPAPTRQDSGAPWRTPWWALMSSSASPGRAWSPGRWWSPWPRTPFSWPWPTRCPRSCRTLPWPTAPPWWAQDGRTFPTRSTTCWSFPACSKARCPAARYRSPRG